MKDFGSIKRKLLLILLKVLNWLLEEFSEYFKINSNLIGHKEWQRKRESETNTQRDRMREIEWARENKGNRQGGHKREKHRE